MGTCFGYWQFRKPLAAAGTWGCLCRAASQGPSWTIVALAILGHGPVHYGLSHWSSSSARSLYPFDPQVQTWLVLSWTLRLGWDNPRHGADPARQPAAVQVHSDSQIQSLHVESGQACCSGLVGAAIRLWPVTSAYPHNRHQGRREDPQAGAKLLLSPHIREENRQGLGRGPGKRGAVKHEMHEQVASA